MKKNNALNKEIKDYAAIVIGCALTALGVVCFTAPNDIAPGGVSGLSTAVSHLTGLPIGTLSLIFNLPVFFAAFRAMGFKALIKSGVSTLLLSTMIDLFSLFSIRYIGNTLLAAVFGGALMGAGIGLLLTRGISTGGTDLLGLVVNKKKPHLSLGTLVLLLDVMIVAIAVVIFWNIEVALYSVVTIFCCSKTIDALVQGVDHAKVAYIITEKPDEMVSALTAMGRGATEIFVRGGYTKDEKTMIMTVAPRRETGKIHKAVKQCDTAAFVIFLDATEVRGLGFKDINS